MKVDAWATTGVIAAQASCRPGERFILITDNDDGAIVAIRAQLRAINESFTTFRTTNPGEYYFHLSNGAVIIIRYGH